MQFHSFCCFFILMSSLICPQILESVWWLIVDHYEDISNSKSLEFLDVQENCCSYSSIVFTFLLKLHNKRFNQSFSTIMFCRKSPYICHPHILPSCYCQKRPIVVDCSSLGFVSRFNFQKFKNLSTSRGSDFYKTVMHFSKKILNIHSV